MKVKAFSVFLILLFLLPFVKVDVVDAAEGGIFHNLPVRGSNGNLIYVLTDGNNNTGLNVRYSPNPIYDFSEPTYILDYYMVGRACIDFYAEPDRKNRIKRIPMIQGTGKWVRVDVEGVMSIGAGTCGAAVNTNLNELDFRSEIPVYPPIGEVLNLSAAALHDKVTLSWVNPSSDRFSKVKIYRERLNSGVIDRLIGASTVSAATVVYEGNGTSFTDTTVDVDTRYEYLITTVDVAGEESNGISRTVRTLEIPIPEIGGEETEVDESGNYTFSWTSPYTGTVKILVGGSEYRIVNASDLEITIPAADMRFTILGAPDVRLIPIDEDGNAGIPTAPPAAGGGIGVVELPFGSIDLLRVTFSFIGILSWLILLAMAIYLVPKIIEVIKKAIEKEKTGRRI